MGGRGRGGNSRKVKRFKSSWLDESVDGTKVRLWCRPDPSNPQRAQCLLCPDTSFNIGEGFTAIRAHSNRKKHQDQLKASQTDPEFQPPQQQMNMEEGLRKMEEARQEDARRFEEALVAETKIVAAYMFHGCSGPLFDCGAELFPKIFKKCEVTKKWKLRRTKVSYIAVHVQSYNVPSDPLVLNLPLGSFVLLCPKNPDPIVIFVHLLWRFVPNE